jgi:hypothetical protein
VAAAGAWASTAASFPASASFKGGFVKSVSAFLAFAAASVSFAAPASATDFSYTGTLSDPNDVLMFNFTVGSPSNITLRSYSYAGGTNAAGTLISGGGFDPILTLFDSTGLEINHNDDGGSAHVPCEAGRCYDVYLQQLLNPGIYTVSIQAYSNFAIGPYLSNGFENDGSFNGRSSSYAFDILNVDQAVQVAGAVPEPSTWAMMLFGFGAAGVALRRQKKKAALATA